MINIFKPRPYTTEIDKLRDQMAFIFSEYVYNILSIERLKLNTEQEKTLVVFRDNEKSEQHYYISRDQHEGLVKAYYAGTQKSSKVMHFLSTATQLVPIEKLPDSLEVDHQCNCECSPPKPMEESNGFYIPSSNQVPPPAPPPAPPENTEQPHSGPEEAFG